MLRKLILAVLSVLRPLRATFLPPSCRFSPTCSQYAVDVLKYHGLAASLKLILSRISRCHPFHPGGYDPAPTSEIYG